MESKEVISKVPSKTLMTQLFGLFIFSYLISSYVPFWDDDLKYVKYALPILPLALILILRQVSAARPLIKYFARNIVLYFFLFVLSSIVAFTDGIYTRFFIEVFLVLAPLLFAFLISLFYTAEGKKTFVRIAFWGTLGTYLLEKGPYLWEILTHPGLLIDAIRTSTIDTESGMAFIFGLFVLYYMMEGDKKYFWTSLVLCVISFKRISLIGIIVCAFTWFLFKKREESVKRFRAVFSLLLLFGNLFIIFIFFQLISGQYDELINHYTGLSPNAFLLGRYDLYTSMIDIIGQVETFGIGFGKTADILLNNNFLLLNLHSDILKHFIEFGPVLFSLWLFYFFYFHLVKMKLFVMALFLNILFISDNVFIYFEVMFFFYFFAIVFINENPREAPPGAPVYE